MQSCNIDYSAKQKTVQDFVAWKTVSVTDAWHKGRTFRFRDCQIWFGVRLTTFDKPQNETRKHPLTGRYVAMSAESSEKKMAQAKSRLEVDFHPDFQRIKRSDKLDSSEVLNQMLEYDRFINLAVQDMPANKTIPEFLFNCVPGMEKPWLKKHEAIRNTLLWVANRMIKDDKDQNASLTLLLATWIEISNAVAMGKCHKSPKGKPYFDWLEVFRFAGLSHYPSSAARRDELVDTGSSSKVSAISRKRKDAAVTGQQNKRQKCQSASARQIAAHIASMEAMINELKKSQDSRITPEERGDIAEFMLTVFESLTTFPLLEKGSNG